MLSVPIYDVNGVRTGAMEIDPKLLGEKIRPQLLKQAIVVHLDNCRQKSARTRSRGMVAGSTRKLYRQKGTGRARMGTIRTNIRRGGGVAFAKQAPVSFKSLSRGMRTLAWRNAVLVKIQSDDAMIVEGLSFEAPKTSRLAATLSKLGADRGCVLATAGMDRMTYLSGRNLLKTEVRPVEELNAYEVLRRKKLLFTKGAFEAMLRRLEGAGGSS